MTETVAPYSARISSPDIDWAATDFAIPGRITPTSLILSPSVTYEDWEQGIAFLGMLESANRFWLGDAIEQGEARFGEKYAQALHLTKLSLGRLKNITYTCRNVEKSRRRDDLSFEHHTVIAPLGPEEQSEWLAQAAEENWDPEQLRDEICKDRSFPPLGSYVDELERANGRLKDELSEARARIEAEAAAECAENPGAAAEEAWKRDRDNITVTCPNCGQTFEVEP